MPWSGTPAERRAYAIKKKRERAALGASQPQPGFKVAPNDHRCDVGDVTAHVHAGTPIVGRKCSVCGREWRYTAAGPFVNVEVTPTSTKCPPRGERSARVTSYVESPTGALGELPPDHLQGEARGRWWAEYGELRRQRREAARARLAS